jgi:hypothetical protein
VRHLRSRSRYAAITTRMAPDDDRKTEEAPAALVQSRSCRPDLRAPSSGWRIGEANLPGHKHAGALDSVPLATTASELQAKVHVRNGVRNSI